MLNFLHSVNSDVFYSAVLLNIHLTGNAGFQRSGFWLSHNLGGAVLSDLPLVAAHSKA